MNRSTWDTRWDKLIDLALEEDVGDGDATTLALVPEASRAAAALVAREDGVLSGIHVAMAVFKRRDAGMRFEALKGDGEGIRSGDTIMRMNGSAGSLLTAERTALNFLQRLSGIATETARYVALAEPYGVRILDTRKTTPGWRSLEKYAVRCGGGVNHRMGLFDRIIIKDNHLACWTSEAVHASLAEAVRAARAAYPALLVEVEVDHLSQLKLVMDEPPDWVLLDNMSPDSVRACVALVNGRAKVEVSGGITASTLPAYAAAGPDAISVGSLTHSARALDVAMDWSYE